MEKLSHTYFKMALAELAERQDGPDVFQKALLYIDKALLANVKPEYIAFKGTVLFKLGHFNEAETLFKQVLESNPSTTLRNEVLNNYACLLAQRGDLEKSKEIWENLTKDVLYQTPEVALVNLGKLLTQKQALNEALNVFTQAVYLAPSYLDAHFYRALVAKQIGNLACAREELSTVLLLEPDHSLARQLAADLDFKNIQ